jgi:hypothetical protein
MMAHQKGSGCNCIKGALIVATLSSQEQTRPDLCRAHGCGAGPEAASVARRRPWRLGGGTGCSEAVPAVPEVRSRCRLSGGGGAGQEVVLATRGQPECQRRPGGGAGPHPHSGKFRSFVNKLNGRFMQCAHNLR